MARTHSFELIFISALSVCGAFLFSTLFGLSFTKAIGISFILLSTFLSFFVTVMLFLNKDKEKKVNKVKTPRNREKYEFVAMETNNKVLKLKPEVIKPQEHKEHKEVVIVKKSPLDSFKENPIGELEQTKDLIITLLKKTHDTYNNIERVFGERMHKNTKTDIQSFLYLKHLNESLSRRLEQVVDTLDEVEKQNKLSLKKSFELAYGPLTMLQDSFNAVISEDSSDLPPLPKEQWEQTVNETIKKLARKKTFHHAIHYTVKF